MNGTAALDDALPTGIFVWEPTRLGPGITPEQSQELLQQFLGGRLPSDWIASDGVHLKPELFHQVRGRYGFSN